MTSGSFTDSFGSKAMHIYQICKPGDSCPAFVPGPTPTPTPCTPSCPGNICENIGQDNGCGGNCPDNLNPPQPCLVADKCQLGTICQSDQTCGGGIPRSCPPSTACVSYSCNSFSGNCEQRNNDGVSCDSNNLCDNPGSGICSNGICRGTPKDCDDSQLCTYDFCDPDTGACSSSNVCGGLVPCGRLVDNPKTGQINEQAPCDLCSTFYMIKGVINFAVEIVFSLAILILVIAGIIYATSIGDQKMVDLARGAVYNTAVGLFIVFLAWILIAAILQGIGYGKMSSWNQVDCTLVAK